MDHEDYKDLDENTRDILCVDEPPTEESRIASVPDRSLYPDVTDDQWDTIKNLIVRPGILQKSENWGNKTNLSDGNYIFAIPATHPDVIKYLWVAAPGSDRDSRPRLYSCAQILKEDDEDIDTIGVSHPCLVNNKRVLGAGEFTVSGGIIINMYPNSSGHYKPPQTSAKYSQYVFQKLGYRFTASF